LPSPPSTLDALASPLLLFRGAAFHLSAFPSSWVPSSSSAAEWGEWTDSPGDLEARSSASPPSVARPEIDLDPARPQKRSYLKFPPAHSGLRLPRCNFQVSHPRPSPPPPPSPPNNPSKPNKPGRPSKSSAKSTAPPSTLVQVGLDEPQEVAQAQLMAAAINRSVKLGYDNPLSRRGDDDAGEEERAIVSVLSGSGEVEERGAVGAREWLRETMDWR
ncbi:hypothetical protein V500_06738, partial [Pseudogymnoascus sp. VKM F-4518 (FW-2643)]